MSETMSNTCATCCLWVRAQNERFGDCLSPKFFQGYLGKAQLLTLSLDSVVVENDEGWAFQTGPEFGCVHHQIRQPSDG